MWCAGAVRIAVVVDLGVGGDQVKRLADGPVALSVIKAGMNRLTAAGFEEGLEFEAETQAVCLGSKDFRTAMIACLKKVDGEFVGE